MTRGVEMLTDLIVRIRERELEVGVGQRDRCAVPYRGRQDEQALVGRIRLQIRRVDRQAGDIAGRPNRAAGGSAEQRKPRLGSWPVRGQRIAEVEECLPDQQRDQNRNGDSPHSPFQTCFLPQPFVRGESLCGVCVGDRSDCAFWRPRDIGCIGSKRRLGNCARGVGHRVQRAGATQRHGRRPQRQVVRLHAFARQRRKRDHLCIAIEHGPAVAAANLPVAQRELSRRDAKDRQAAGAARVFFVDGGHCEIQAARRANAARPRAAPILPRFATLKCRTSVDTFR